METQLLEMREPQKTIFGAPLWESDKTYDVVFVGIPTDFGTLGLRSTRGGPSTIRSASHIIPIELDQNGRPVGWYDYTSDQPILKGVSFADAGDFPVSKHLGMEQLDVLPQLYRCLAATAKLLVILGGDHSIAYWLAKSLDGEGLLLIDAHEDATEIKAPYPHHGNFVSFIDQMVESPTVLQFGLRGLVPHRRREPSWNRKICPDDQAVIDTLQKQGTEKLAISIDVDVFDPSGFESVCAPSPDGLSPKQILSLLKRVSSTDVQVTVLEIAEFAPIQDSDALPAFLLIQFLLRSIEICLNR